MPGDPGATVVTNARAYYSTRAAAGATGTRHSPLSPWGSATPSLWAKDSATTRAHGAARRRRRILPSLLRQTRSVCARKRSNPSCRKARMDCFVASLLAMTPHPSSSLSLPLFGAAHQLDVWRCRLRQAAVGGEIVERHAARREALFKLLSDGIAVQAREPADDGDRAGFVFEDEA